MRQRQQVFSEDRWNSNRKAELVSGANLAFYMICGKIAIGIVRFKFANEKESCGNEFKKNADVGIHIFCFIFG